MPQLFSFSSMNRGLESFGTDTSDTIVEKLRSKDVPVEDAETALNWCITREGDGYKAVTRRGIKADRVALETYLGEKKTGSAAITGVQTNRNKLVQIVVNNELFEQGVITGADHQLD